ncbi:hypothetical protein EVG20_g5914 [Dentipellis fragilis]|uniref:Uncharacterized protein n=1 Tax=Dentipellis fragilis TaxID=205917 RepID=A0A4Y9YSN3_9AGAM|nr:hypothetical protein EVG20_g5914 [Dentipellis fragilis]
MILVLTYVYAGSPPTPGYHIHQHLAHPPSAIHLPDPASLTGDSLHTDSRLVPAANFLAARSPAQYDSPPSLDGYRLHKGSPRTARRRGAVRLPNTHPLSGHVLLSPAFVRTYTVTHGSRVHSLCRRGQADRGADITIRGAGISDFGNQLQA